ncbi:VWA domain-containing protein [Pelagicoccus sp. SDUM812003]|uniref:VWA domain-containing protein n=1 Tax=Pelagicoccus sp. SDUM812003 TaxID=3041267 RepID=UPI0028109E3A|nr:VWA domain-containing protein [Pelagicoccus sp. SDUM812003]
MNTLRFESPYWFLALLLLPLVAWLRGRRSVAALILPFAGSWKRQTFVGSSKLPTLFAFLTALGIIVALARPQSVATEKHSKSLGYDIILAIDLSGSMEAEDYVVDRQRVNRLQAVKPVLSAFINKRENDRIGIIAFAGRAYTVAPLTFNHEWLGKQTERLQIGLIEDGTAIGDAIAVASSRLLEGAKERAGEREGAFIVLLTDGENTAGMMEPMEGAKLAKDANIRVYTIAAGRNGYVPFPRRNQAGERIGTTRQLMRVDIETLQKIAGETNGEFFRAEDSDTIESAFSKIDESSKIEFEVQQYSVVTELFPFVLMFSGACAVLSVATSVRESKEALA